MPGYYTLVLTVNGKKYSQPIVVRMDPRLKTPTAELTEQFRLSKQLYDQWLALASIAENARAQLKKTALGREKKFTSGVS